MNKRNVKPVKRKSPPSGKSEIRNPKSEIVKRGPGRPRKHPLPNEIVLEKFLARFPKKFDAHTAAKLARSPKPDEPYRPMVNEICIALGKRARCHAIGHNTYYHFTPVDQDNEDIPNSKTFTVLVGELAAGVRPAPPLRDPLPIHPLAERFTPLSAARYATLRDSIRDNGQIDPVILYKGEVIDGRHRDKACCELGIETRTEEFDPVKHRAATPMEFVISRVSGRMATEEQLVCTAELFMDDLAKGRTTGRPSKKSSADPALLKGKSSDIAARKFGVAARAIEEVRRVRLEAPDVYKRLFAGERKLTINAAVNQLKQHVAATAAHSLQDVPVTFKPADLRLIHGDCADVMHDLKKAGESFTCIFTDPPYNIGYHYDADPHHDQLPHDRYLHGLRKTLKAASDLLTEDGSIYVLIDDANSDHVGLILRDLGLHRRGAIVWWESFAQHNPNDFTCCTRYVHYYTKSRTYYCWTPPMVPSARLEVYKDARANPRGKVPDNVWTVSRKQGTANDRVPFEDAPPQIPVEIPARCILTSSTTGDAILDCYNGNGTTGLAALMHGRRYTGIDRSKKYLDQSRKFITSQLKAAANVEESK